MKASTYLISYHPYENRDERCSIGVLVFDHQNNVQVITGTNLRKIRSLNPSCDYNSLIAGLKTLEAHLNENKLAWDALKHGFGSFRFSEKPGCFVYQNLHEFEKQIHVLLSFMVEPSRSNAKNVRKNKTGLFIQLKRAFTEFGWLAKNKDEINNHKIVTKYQLSNDTHLKSEFAMKNGKLHLVETIDFRTGTTNERRLETQSKALVMDYAKDLFKDEAICTAIIAATDYENVKSSLNILNKYADKVIYSNSASDMDGFFKDWGNKIGKPLQPLPLLNF